MGGAEGRGRQREGSGRDSPVRQRGRLAAGRSAGRRRGGDPYRASGPIDLRQPPTPARPGRGLGFGSGAWPERLGKGAECRPEPGAGEAEEAEAWARRYGTVHLGPRPYPGRAYPAAVAGVRAVLRPALRCTVPLPHAGRDAGRPVPLPPCPGSTVDPATHPRSSAPPAPPACPLVARLRWWLCPPCPSADAAACTASGPPRPEQHRGLSGGGGRRLPLTMPPHERGRSGESHPPAPASSAMLAVPDDHRQFFAQDGRVVTCLLNGHRMPADAAVVQQFTK